MMRNRVRLIGGDCRRVMRLMAALGIMVDSIVCDPPYHLTSIVKRFGGKAAAPARSNGATGVYARSARGFMGQEWDGGDIAFDPETWALAMAVLKPGGHLLAFGGTRGWHRMACAIEDAGFEIRDTIAWLYGSGFPKSHDVAKAIDAADAIGFRRERALRFTEWMRSTGISARRINDITGSCMASHYLTDKEQPEIAAPEMFDQLRPYLPAVPDWVEDLVRSRAVESENLKKREVLETRHDDSERNVGILSGKGEYAVTAAHTEAARAWEGWGTALKPALEPVVVARKPLGQGSVAANVMRHGTGAINVGGCGVEAPEGKPKRVQHDSDSGMFGLGSAHMDGTTDEDRWPANLVHDGSPEVLARFSHSGHGDRARFFYSAKAGPEDRFGSKHPTVKPVSLIRWLQRLVTPPGGLTLDPFAGSGTAGVAALAEGFRAILIERDPDYQADIRERLAWATGEGRHALAVKARNVPPEKAAGADLPLFQSTSGAAE